MNLRHFIRQIVSEKGYFTIKLISLTLGLALGVTLISKLTEALSADKFWKDSDRIYRIKGVLKATENNKIYEDFVIMAPLAPMVAGEVPAIEYGVTTSRPWIRNFRYEKDDHRVELIYSHPTLFQILSINVFQGDPELLKIENNIMISESLRYRIFGDKDPVGEVILYDGLIEYTVVGVFEDIDENSHLKVDAIGSFENITKQFKMYTGLDGGDSFWGYLKLHKGADYLDVEKQANSLIASHPDAIAAKEAGWEQSIMLVPIRQSVTGDPEFKRMAWIMGIVGFAVILISIINYIMISVASVVTRSKSIGIRKSSGALDIDIFRSFIWESCLVMLIAAIFSVLIQYGLGLELSEIYSLNNIWPILTFIVVFLFCSSFIPARILSRLPVRSTLSIKTPNFIVLKQSLMLFLFLSTSLLISLLLMVSLQYRLLTHKDIGYNYSDKVVVTMTNLESDKYNLIKSEIERLPFVNQVSRVGLSPITGLSGFGINDPESNKILFSSRILQAERDYLDMMGMEIIAGNGLPEGYDPYQFVVNETFIKSARISGNPVGQVFNSQWGNSTIAGVVQDFNADPLYTDQQPVVISTLSPRSKNFDLTIKMNKIDPEKLSDIDKKIKEIVPHHTAEIRTYKAMVESSYSMIYEIKNLIVIASLIALFIALLGIISYMSDEIVKKSKEIAVRKVHGATSSDVIRLLSRRIMIIATISIIIGSIGSYVIGGILLQNFAYRISLSLWIFLSGALIVYIFLSLTLLIQTYRIANENPVKTITNQE